MVIIKDSAEMLEVPLTDSNTCLIFYLGYSSKQVSSAPKARKLQHFVALVKNIALIKANRVAKIYNSM